MDGNLAFGSLFMAYLLPHFPVYSTANLPTKVFIEYALLSVSAALREKISESHAEPQRKSDSLPRAIPGLTVGLCAGILAVVSAYS
jgi:hypothetical protein